MNTQHKLGLALACFVIPCAAFALDTLYCPQKHGYISLGMTTDQVLAACGNPISMQEAKRAFTEKVPVQELIYNNMGTQQAIHAPFYVHIGSGGTQLQINLVNNKVKSINVNGGGTNAASFCEGLPIQVGDEANKVYANCGAPTIVNNSFTNEPIKTVTKPMEWIYQPGDNQASVTLTFVDGKLQSIN